MPELDVVIPVYNEGSGIVAVLEALESSVQTPFRVLICYDREDDDTLPALAKYSPGGLEIVLVRNRGVGPHDAVMSGFCSSTAPAVLVYPADDSYNTGILDSMYQKFAAGCDIVAASRFIAGGCMEGCPWLKAVMVRASAFTLHHLAKISTHDASNGFRLFSRRVLEQIEVESSQGFTYSIELLVKTHRLGWRICEVPARWFERKSGASRFRVLRWAGAYLRWYFYAFATTYLRRGPETVPIRKTSLASSENSFFRQRSQ
ncbi:MAG TPA: glycosyltransferase family 2 protein [Terriglobales bacterium]|nr:glycosyltransferase family 2 protein [Terriglobales bacterium]